LQFPSFFFFCDGDDAVIETVAAASDGVQFKNGVAISNCVRFFPRHAL